MTITCTITKAGRFDEYGRPLTVAQSYTGSYYFVKDLVQSGYATASASLLDDDEFPLGYVQASVPSGTSAVAAYVDHLTGGSSLSSAGQSIYMGPQKVAQSPYKLASYGDSRANTNSTNADVSGSTLSPTKTTSWLAAIRKDTELTHNFGVSGDPVSGWALASRNGAVTTKQFQTFILSGVDMVHVQDGVNDILSGNGTTPTAATITAAQKALCMEAIKSGIVVIYESILPCTAAGWVSAGSGTAAQKQAIADQCNSIMQTWLAQFPFAAVYVDTATALKDGTGYANASLYADLVHLNPTGAKQCAKALASASLGILPRKFGVFFPSGIIGGANFIDLNAPNITNVCMAASGSYASGINNITGQQVGGSVTLNSCVSGVDASGPYIDYSITATALASGEATFWTTIGGDVGSFGGTPKYTISANDVLQGQCRMIVDNGFDDVPSGLSNIVVRQRIYYQAGGGTFADWGANTVPSTFPNLGEKIDALFTTPRMTTTAASSGVEPSTHAKGYGLHIYISILQAGVPVRFRVYAPSLRKAA